MVLPITEVYSCLTLFIIICTLLCFAECGKCPREVLTKPLYYDVYSSSYTSHYGSERQKKVPFDENSCCTSESLSFPSKLYGFGSKTQCSRERNLDINTTKSECGLTRKSIRSDGNVSWSKNNNDVFHLFDGGTIKCSLNFRELGLEELPHSVNFVDQIVFSSCRGHLLSKKESNSSLWNIEIQKSPVSESSYPRVNINPSKLNWGKSYIYHSYLASLRLKNTCNESVLTVYRPFSTDPQFYSFNFSDVVLGPGEITTLTFTYLPSKLGYSSAELVLLTSFGGFLIEVNGFGVESPHKLRPFVGFDGFSERFSSRKLSLFNPFDEIINLEEVTTLISVFKGSNSMLVESICKKQKVRDSQNYSFSSDNKYLEPMVFGVKPLSNWLISPHKTQTILEMAFLPDLKGKVIGGICMEIFKPLKGEKDTLVVPFEADLNKKESRKDSGFPLSVSFDVVGSCDTNETMISISIRNHGSNLLKIVKINEIVDGRNLFRIKYFEGFLLFPEEITRVALVAYESLKVEYDWFREIPNVSFSCKVEIVVNDSFAPRLEVPCLEIIGLCPLQEDEWSLPGIEKKSPILTEALKGAEADMFLLEGLKARDTMNGPFLLDAHEILFPKVVIGENYAKSITIRNPSDQPVIIQLILNSGEMIDNCKTCSNQHSHLPSNFIGDDSTRVNGSGFSFSDISVTEAFLHPRGIISLGPILFNPSNRCEWKGSAFIRSNLSGLEPVSLYGFGGALSLTMLEGSEPVKRLDFNLNSSFSQNTTNIEKIRSWCHKPLLKKLYVVNDGDFSVVVKRIDVSGRECGSDGFLVHNCRGFSLEPGESIELGLSYWSDFSMVLVQRELELIFGVGKHVIPIQANLPLDVLSLCAQPVFWSDIKRYSWAIILTLVLIFLLVRNGIHYHGTQKIVKSIKTGHEDRSRDSRIEINHCSEDIKEIIFSPAIPTKTLPIEKPGKAEVAPQPVCLTVKTRKGRKRRSSKKNALIEVSSSQSGNSTPTSPLSPVTTLSPPETRSPSLQPELRPSINVPEIPDSKFPGGAQKVGTRVVFTPSATFPGVMRNSPSRLAVGPHARAPGRKINSVNGVQFRETEKDDRFTYDIWGNHLSGIHLCRGNSEIMIIPSGRSSDSFFLRGPRQTLMTNFQPPSVSKFCDDG